MTELKAANVSDATINSIVSDFKSYEQTLKTIDPSLTVKIKADGAALAKDMPALPVQPAGHPDRMLEAPGFPVGHSFGL
jgi:hypothetical protein